MLNTSQLLNELNVRYTMALCEKTEHGKRNEKFQPSSEFFIVVYILKH